jgi:hypothetical protein
LGSGDFGLNLGEKTMKTIIIRLAIVAIVGIAALIASRYLLIFTKDSVVDTQSYLGKHNNSADIYAHPPTGLLYSPLNISIAPMDRLMLVNFLDDPEYYSIELQVFDDSRGPGARVILYRNQGPADFYYTSEAFADGEKPEAAFIIPDLEYRFEVTESGLDAGLKMKDSKGKSIEFQVKEAPRAKNSKGVLAPIGGTTEIKFDYFPFFFLRNMNFIPRSGSEISIHIGGQARTPQQIPLPVNLEFVYLSRYTADPVLGSWNKSYADILSPIQPGQQLTYQDGQTRYELVDNAGHAEIRKIIGFDDKHAISLEFSPPIPDLPGLKDGLALNGRFSAGADEVLGIVAGEYHIQRHGDVIEMEIFPLEGYQPNPGAIWVKTWVWKGVITVSADKTVSMKSGWVRKE